MDAALLFNPVAPLFSNIGYSPAELAFASISKRLLRSQNHLDGLIKICGAAAFKKQLESGPEISLRRSFLPRTVTQTVWNSALNPQTR